MVFKLGSLEHQNRIILSVSILHADFGGVSLTSSIKWILGLCVFL